MKYFKRYVNETVNIYPIDSLPEEFSQAQKKDMPSWKLDKVKILLTHFNEPMLNLHFLNPYLKSNASIFTYRLILRILH